ncbi:MAG: hypothetical protein H6741_13825 [Alphaproteobacteria bacterium]|nr:hypothetical protein [Alphaproteobacteria bacterium]
MARALSPAQSAAIDALAARFEASFPEGKPAWRTVGREAEHPLVRDDGSVGDVASLWPLLAEGGDLEVQREGALITGLEGPRYTYSAEVGVGTIEVITGPEQDLHGIKEAHEAAIRRLVAAAEATGQHLLGYGIQPRTPASPGIMTGKGRYGELLKVLGEPWLWFTLTASDQVHGAVGREEMIPLTNLTNLLSPVVVALCANSPVFGGAPSGWASAREGTMGGIHAHTYRHGMPRGPFRDTRDFVLHMCDQELLLEYRDGQKLAASGNFLDWLEREGPDFDAFLLHEHYIWNSARPRSNHATIELRPACQQPPGEHMAAAALGFSIIEAGAELAAWIDGWLGDEAWPLLRAWHEAVLHEGLAAPGEPEGLVMGVLERCAEGLRRRGRGEEVYLAPLFERARRRESPAHWSRVVLDEPVPARLSWNATLKA